MARLLTGDLDLELTGVGLEPDEHAGRALAQTPGPFAGPTYRRWNGSERSLGKAVKSQRKAQEGL